MIAANPWFINTKLNQNLDPPAYNQKHLRMFIFPLEAEQSVAEWRIVHTNRFFNTDQWFEG